MNLSNISEHGFGFIPGSEYIDHLNNFDTDFCAFKDRFTASLAPDDVRNRAYLKLNWDRATDAVSVADNQNYFQSAASNVDDGGKVRTFATIDPSILESPVMQSLVNHNLNRIKSFEPLSQYNALTFGIHFIQYLAPEMGASFSSPMGLHIDDELLVFVHLIELTPNAIGGDNLIAGLENKKIKHVIRLKNPLDTICLSQSVYHAVTPLGSSHQEAHRNIILFTIEPAQTQVVSG